MQDPLNTGLGGVSLEKEMEDDRESSRVGKMAKVEKELQRPAEEDGVSQVPRELMYRHVCHLHNRGSDIE